LVRSASNLGGLVGLDPVDDLGNSSDHDSITLFIQSITSTKEGEDKERERREGRTTVSADLMRAQTTSSFPSRYSTVLFSANHWSMAFTMTWQAT
jgi:hypothetical protein